MVKFVLEKVSSIRASLHIFDSSWFINLYDLTESVYKFSVDLSNFEPRYTSFYRL